MARRRRGGRTAGRPPAPQGPGGPRHPRPPRVRVPRRRLGPVRDADPREREVLRLVAEGYNNRRIAEALFISPKTASVHVSNILGKLGVTSRTQAAALAHREGLPTS
ncbi:response regulator transcription factor [Actinomadura keratinilytica]|uniref:response regulator transcription factor n=1 Tax=Actinomadura keratinilytica TaxID=547461 RepID=UPI00361E601E